MTRFALFSLTMIMLTACEPSAEGEPESPEPEAPLVEGFSADELAEGERLVRESGCFVCHGSDLRGTQLGPSLREIAADAGAPATDQLARAIARGTEEPDAYPVRMPPRGGAPLDDEQIRLVSGYLAQINRAER